MQGVLAIRESVECVDHFIGAHPTREMHFDLDVLSRIVLYLPDLDLPFLVRFHDGIDQAARGRSVRDLGNGEGSLVLILLDPCTDPDPPPTFPIVVLIHLDQTSRREIRVKFGCSSLQDIDRGIDQFVKVVRKDTAGEPHSDPLHPLGKEEREFNRKGDRFIIPSVVGKLPFGDLLVETNLLRE